MAFIDPLSKKSVLKAIAEFDTLGRESFLEKYGYEKARSYFLVHSGCLYDSKAIVGAAHGHQYGLALAPSEFSGGKATVQRKLEELGFRIKTLDRHDVVTTYAGDVPETLWEGARLTVTVNKYERSKKARTRCLEVHGTSCAICNFDFGAKYGAAFEGFIHVHHLVPLSKIGKGYRVKPVKDLVPVCPNCHAVLHFGGVQSTLEEVKAAVSKARRRHK